MKILQDTFFYGENKVRIHLKERAENRAKFSASRNSTTKSFTAVILYLLI